MDIKEIAKPVSGHIEDFEMYFKNLMKSKVSLLDLIVRYITKKKGKRVRPLLVFLSADICGGVNPRSYIAASMAELLHTATLVHDDVVDEASERRGIASINSAWSNKIAVLFGDYLLSKGLLAAIDNNEFDFLKILSESVKRMSEGELLQIQKSKEYELDEETYFKIISDKTASLIATCTEIGAVSSSSDIVKRKQMKIYGEHVGLAFQIRDDIFDYSSKSKKIGKPVGNDIKEKKITLPLLYSLSQVPKSQAKAIINMVKTDSINKKNIDEIVSFVINNGGIDYSREKARELSVTATNALSVFPDSPSKTSLINFANFVIDRDK